MGPRIREDTSGDGFPSLSSRGQALRRHSRGDVSPHPRGHGGGEDFPPILALPPSRGKEKERGWFPVSVFTRSGSAPAFTRGCVPASARTRGGEDFTPILAFPPPRGKEKERGWVPRLCLHRGQALRRHSRGDGSPHPRGHGGGGGTSHPCLHEVLAFPAPRGKEKERGWFPASARTRGGGERLSPPS